MKKLLFIFTGGTIGSTISGDYISTDPDKPYLLIKGYEKRYGDLGEYDVLSPYTVLSENLNGEHLSKLLDTVSENVDKYRGIIVTHGTDTLAYSSAALSYALGNFKIPVCLVSANYPLEDSRSNGFWNLKGGIEFIEKIGKGGVWVSYTNDDGITKIHKGSRICPHGCYSHEVFSVKNSFFGSFDSDFNFKFNPDYSEKNDEISPIKPKLLHECERVMRIEPYVSMVYPKIPSGVKYILMGSYHSGTLDTSSRSAKMFYENAKALGVKVFLVGAERGIQYESTSEYSKLGIIPLPPTSPVSAYVKLWFLSSEEGRCVEKEVSLSLGGDVV